MSKNKELVQNMLSHPDRDEIISKLLLGFPLSDINEWLSVKYDKEQKYVFSEKSLEIFKDEYLDIYTQIKEDIIKLYEKQNTPDQEIKEVIKSNSDYQDKLTEYLNQEIDIHTRLKRMIFNIQYRAEQVFDTIQENPRNTKMDRTLIEWFNTLSDVFEKYDKIINKPQEQILQQQNNNINIQILDQHIGVVYEIIKEILAKLDYNTSMLFIDLFNEKIKKIKSTPINILPVEERLEQVKQLETQILSNLEKTDN